MYLKPMIRSDGARIPGAAVSNRAPIFKEPENSNRFEQVIAAMDRISTRSLSLNSNKTARFESAGRSYCLPRYLFLGPRGGGDPIRLAIFAGIHGDEHEGVYALLRFVELLERDLELARGYCLFLYPVCNPSGFEDRTRNARSGKDLNREFWRGTNEPEVKLLESELLSHALDGIISLHTDETSDGFYGYAHGATLTRSLLEPALKAAEEFLPVNRQEVIDGFPAKNGIIRDRFAGSLCCPPKVRLRPFEIILETPQSPPEYLKEAALVAALRKILAGYRELMAYAPNL